MNRNLYIFIITLAFTIAYIPDALSVIFQERILIDHIPRTRIKTILIFLICIMESTLIKKQIPGMVGWALTFFLFVGLQIWILRWTWGAVILITSLLLILINLVTFAYIEKNKNLFHYLLFLFVAQRITIILMPPNNFLWWSDLVLGTLIAIVGIMQTIGIIKKNRTIV